jgi:hypothetical protein
MMKIINKYIFEILILLFIAVVLFIQLEGNYSDLGWYFVTLVLISFFLFIFAFFRVSLLSLLEDIKTSTSLKHYKELPIFGKLLLMFILGLFISLIFAVAEMFNLFFIISDAKTSHLGVPFKFLPLDGNFMLSPFIANGLFFTVALYLYGKIAKKY